MTDEKKDVSENHTLKVIKPLADRKDAKTTSFSETNPAYYPDEFTSGYEHLLKTPLPNGELVPLTKLPKEKEQSQYWNSKLQVTGLVIAGSMLILIVMLMQETDFLKVAWSIALKGVGIQ